MKPTKQLPKIIVIVGPTSTGKSDFGVVLARKFNGEIISADSRQVYKGMDIGTGKITKKETQDVKHYALDVVSPRSSFNVSKFKKLADKYIKEILKKDKLPLLVGGTGFWIDAVALNQEMPDVKANPKLRAKLNKLSAEKLFTMLQKLDPKRAQSIDRMNKRRVVRAIEIAKATKRSSTEFALQAKPIYQTLYIGLDITDKQLHDKIEKRLDKRLKQGMVAEVKKLRSQGVTWKKLESFGLEYRFVSRFLRGEITREQMHNELLTAIWQYAKRQRTWFKRNKDILWLDPSKKQSLNKGIALVKEYLKD